MVDLHLLLKMHKSGQDYNCLGDCVSLSPPLPPESLPFLGKLSTSCEKHTLFLLWPRSNRKCAKIITAAKTKDYSPRHAHVIRLRPACAQRKTHAVLRAAAYWLSYF